MIVECIHVTKKIAHKKNEMIIANDDVTFNTIRRSVWLTWAKWGRKDYKDCISESNVRLDDLRASLAASTSLQLPEIISICLSGASLSLAGRS